MNVYSTETEQIENIKQWFKKYGHWFFSFILLILLIVGGDRLWERHIEKIKSQASERYQQLMVGVADGDTSLIEAQAIDLIQHFSGTVYAEAALLTQAKLLITEGKYKKALSKLNRVITKGKTPALQQIARLRSAKILRLVSPQESGVSDNLQHALSLLKTVDDSSYSPAINEMKGDIYLNLNDKQKARVFYLKAMNGFSKTHLNNPLLEMKLNEISK
jgi:predicted negative regulator of RcsB-dependent stress response